MKNAFEYEAELAALREELAEKQALSEIFYKRQQISESKLKTAEQRNEYLVSVIRESLEAMQDLGERHGIKRCRELSQEFERALQPTESGGAQ